MLGFFLGLTVALDPVVVSEQEWQGSRWVVAEVDLTRARVDLLGQRPRSPEPHTLARTAEALRGEGRVPLFATNAGIYTMDRRPLGLHIESGVRYRDTNRADGEGNFYLHPNGVFFIGDRGAGVVATSEVPSELNHWQLATQSGPLLLRHGVVHPAFLPNSRSRKVRSLVAVCGPERVVFAISTSRVRFIDAATLVRDHLGCADGLYLDGTISEYWTPDRPTVEGDPAGYGGVLVVSVPAAD